MVRSMSLGLLLAPLLAGAAFANAPIVGMMVGSNTTDVHKAFEALGYEILYVGMDEMFIEADIRDSNGIYDVFVDPETGLILTVEIDEDDDGDA